MTDSSKLLWWCKKASFAWNRNLVEIESWCGNEHQRNCLCCLWHLTAWAHIVLNHLHSLPTLSLSTEGLSNTQPGDQGISMGYSHVSIKCCGNIHCCISCLAFSVHSLSWLKGTSNVAFFARAEPKRHAVIVTPRCRKRVEGVPAVIVMFLKGNHFPPQKWETNSTITGWSKTIEAPLWANHYNVLCITTINHQHWNDASTKEKDDVGSISGDTFQMWNQLGVIIKSRCFTGLHRIYPSSRCVKTGISPSSVPVWLISAA